MFLKSIPSEKDTDVVSIHDQHDTELLTLNKKTKELRVFINMTSDDMLEVFEFITNWICPSFFDHDQSNLSEVGAE